MTRLSLNKAGGGVGTVRSLLGGIDCGPACNSQHADYSRLARVVLVATPSGNSHFDGWDGDGDNVNVAGQASVARHLGMGRDRNVTARFSAGPWLKPDLVIQNMLWAPDALRLKFRLKNIGGAPSGRCLVRVDVLQQRLVFDPFRGPEFIELQHFLPDEIAFDGLPPGAFRTKELSYTMAPQNNGVRTDSSRQATVTFTVDVMNQVDESSESNNSAVLHGTLRDSVYA